MAEALLKHSLMAANKSGYIVQSAGLGALVDHAPDKTACDLLSKKGIDISTYRATQINSAMVRNADLILVMEIGHKKALIAQEPSSQGKIFRLGEWGGFDVPDPYQKGIAEFELALELIEQGITHWLPKL